MATTDHQLSDLKSVFDYLDKRLKNVATKADINHLPTKKDFFKRMDQLSAEIQTVREEQIIHSGQHSTIEDRLEFLESKVNLTS